MSSRSTKPFGSWAQSGACAAACVLLGPPAIAAGAATSSEGAGLEEIIVTAERREERLDKVPISVMAITPGKRWTICTSRISRISRASPPV